MADCIVAVVSDLHSNSTIGLCPYSFNLDDGGTYKASKAQRWLWRNWQDYWKRIANLSQDTGLPVVAVVNGDITDGDHHGSPQLITRNDADQLRLGIAVLEPVLNTARRVFVVRGTEAHVGKSASLEEMIAQDIGAEPSPWGPSPTSSPSSSTAPSSSRRTRWDVNPGSRPCRQRTDHRRPGRQPAGARS